MFLQDKFPPQNLFFATGSIRIIIKTRATIRTGI